MNILLTYAGRIVTIVLAIAILRRLVKIMMEEKIKDEENKKTVSLEPRPLKYRGKRHKKRRKCLITPDDTNMGKVPWDNMDPKKTNKCLSQTNLFIFSNKNGRHRETDIN